METKMLRRFLIRVLTLAILILVADSGVSTPAEDLSGLWQAKRRFGPFGPTRLVVTQGPGGYRADMLGWSVPIEAQDGQLQFTLPDDRGSFRGKLNRDRHLVGHWFREGTPPNLARYASPVHLKPDGRGRWSGTVRTLEDTFTLFLLLRQESPDSWTAVLRNSERDLGSQWRVTRLIRERGGLQLLGTRTGKEEPVAMGAFDAEQEAITLLFPTRGGSYDLTRASDESDFYPRGKDPAPYVYTPPLKRDDGWPVGTLETASIDRPAMERFIQKLLELPMDAADAPQFHGLLIARHGKLVLEEYFHGEHREKLHDTRSASKSMTAVLVGAVMQDGAPLRLDSPVYQVMNGGSFPAEIDSLKRRMTLEHLLTMSSGHFCDDTDENAPGNEERMIDQTEEPDHYRYILKVPMATPPGENSVYCSGVANLVLGMVGHALGEFPLYAFDRLIAGPMKLETYAWPLDPAGNAFGGGSTQFVLRDFLKFGQLLLNEGQWDGRQILSREFARQAISPQYHLRNITYGYLWWVEDLPYKRRTVRAFLALGAGAQTIVGIPELDLVIGIHAGNYSSRTQGKLRENVPRFILPAVREPGDDKNAPVVEQDYKNPYGRSADGSRVQDE